MVDTVDTVDTDRALEFETAPGQAWGDGTRLLRVERRGRARGWRTTPRQLVEEAQLLDARAISILCGVYRQPLTNFLRRRGASQALAEDVTQSYLLGLLRRGDFAKIEPGHSFGAWLRSGAYHQLLNERRKEKAQSRLRSEQQTAELLRLEEERRGASSERLVDRRRALVLIERAWARLGLEYQRLGSELLFEHLKRSLSREETALSDAELCRQLGRSDSYVAVMRLRLKNHEFPAALLAELKASRPTECQGRGASAVEKARPIRDELRALLDALT